MTLEEVSAIRRGWLRAPPTHRLVAAFMGVKHGSEAPAHADPGPEFAALVERAKKTKQRGTKERE